MSPTQKPPAPSAVLSDLAQVATQVEEAKGRDTETLNKARACNRFGDFLKENTELLKGLGATEESIEATVEDVKSFADMFAPQADLTWDQAEIQQKIAYLDALVPFGSLSDEEVASFEAAKETLSSASKGTGIRAERKPQERIEGRPQRVITSLGETVKSNQAGNLPNSVSNIKNAAVKALNGVLEAQGTQLTETHAEDIMKAIKEVVEEGKPSSTVHGLTFTAAAESEE